MPLESKRRSASQRLMIVFIVGWIVFSFILSRYTKITFSAGYENLVVKDQYYMPSYWGSHKCSRSSSPCKDIPDYFKGSIYQICNDQSLTNFWKIRKSESYMARFYKVSTTMSKWLYDKIYQIESIQFWVAKSRPKSYQKSTQRIQSNFISHR